MRSVSTRSGTVWSALWLFALPQIADSEDIDNRTIYLLANEIADNVELIREVMGRPYDDSPRLPASEVSERELLLSVQTLFRKANQLAREAGVADRRSPPAAPPDRIQAADIFGTLELASGQIMLVKEAFEITETIEPLRRESDISTTGVFMTIVDVNRQLNLMLDETISPDDVFDRIALVNLYAAGIVHRLDADAPQPVLPPVSSHYYPADVYAKLLECLDLIGEIAERVDGARVMSLSSRRNIPDDIEPGHVYDIAQIVVADVATLSVALDALDTTALDFPVPKRIFPTQVYQRAALLLSQLEAIDALL